jgi:hypothetical protein
MDLIKQYLFEDEVADFARLYKLLKPCKPFLERFATDFENDHFLVRGERDNGSDATVRKTFGRRIPSDTAKKFSYKFGQLMKKHLGHNFRENYVVFSRVSDGIEKHNVSDYGDVYYIFPLGEYKIAYSPNIYDLYFQVCNTSLSSYSRRSSPELMQKMSEFIVEKVLKPIEKKLNVKIVDLSEIRQNIEFFIDELYDAYMLDDLSKRRLSDKATTWLKEVAFEFEQDWKSTETHSDFFKKIDKALIDIILDSEFKTVFLDLSFTLMNYSTDITSLESINDRMRI